MKVTGGRWTRLVSGLALGGAGLGFALFAAAAQDAGDSTDGLNLPSNVQILEHKDPTVRRATAIVDGTIITDTDIDQRMGLVLAANGNKLSQEERDRLRLQVLSNMVDEILEIKEAAANKVVVSKDEIDQAFARVAQNFKQQPSQFGSYLRAQGSSEASMKKQIEGEIAWRRLLGREVEPFVNVSEDEVKQVIARLQASKGAFEYHVGEIYLSANPTNQDQVLARANQLVDQMRQGASFVALAHEYSEASTRAVGGDLGWVRAEQLPDSMSAAIQQIQQGQISDPIPVNGGYSIVALIDKRQVLTTDPRDAILALKQITVSFPAGTKREQAEPKINAFGVALQSLKGCGDAEAVAAKVGGNVVANDAVKIRDLPPALQTIMGGLRVGEVSPPFGSLADGVRALVVCGRDEPEAAGLPSFEQIQSQMEEERVNLRARRYLRDLRRDAVIEYR